MYKEIQAQISGEGFQSLGNFESVSSIENGIQGRTDFGQFRVLIFDHAIFRISVTRNDTFDDFSYAVVGQPKGVSFEIEEGDDHLLICTKKVQLHISKSPARFKFLTSSGEIINEDDASFGVSWIGNEVTSYKKLQSDERFIGLGEKTGDLDRRGQGYVNWNTDHFAYGVDSDPIYGSYPFYIGLHSRLAYGIFMDNSHKSHFNFGASNNRFASFMAEDGDMDYYFIHNEEVADIIKDYTYLTGRMPMPPIWSLGYQQCRYSYYPDKKVINVAQSFRDKKIPADAIVLDIHYMDKYKIFTWDPEKFPNPAEMVRKLRELNFKVVVMCDPGIKREEGYAPYEEGIREDVFLKYPDHQPYSAEVWPGWCHFPDFTKKEARAWWGKSLKSYAELGVDGYWNDMNEIASWGQMMPENIVFNYDGNGGFTKKGKNIYGFQMARSTFEGVHGTDAGQRFFNLTRSGFSGVQRYSAVWTGDNYASDEHMLLGVRLVNSLGLTGVAFSGYDVGGFAGEASVELFARWISLGAFSPFYRGHSMINSRDAEPWAFGEMVEEISRNYINLRYRLLPYLYSIFYEATKTGMPINRSLAISYTHDHHIYDLKYQNQYLFGPAFLVCPVTSEARYCKAYLPEGTWYDFHTGQKYNGKQEVIVDAPLEILPVFVKAGSIIPMQETVQSTEEQGGDRLIIHLYLGKIENHFLYYNDDGLTDSQEQENYYSREMILSEGSFTLKAPKGNFSSRFKYFELVFHGLDNVNLLESNQGQLKLENYQMSYLDPITKFDPVVDAGVVHLEKIKSLVIENSQDQVEIIWK